MYINPKFLMHFVEVAEKGSLTEAAESLGLTQPALSRNMKELEAQMGDALLVRDRQGARLTELGQRALPYAQSLRKTLERVTIEAQAWRRGHIGSLQIGATPQPATLIPPVLSAFLAERAGVHASISVSGILPLIDRLANGELDLVIGPIGIEQLPPGIVLSTLFTDELVLVAGAGHRLAGETQIDVADLDRARWLGPPPDSAIRRQVESILVSLGVTQVDYNIIVAGIDSAIDILATGEHLAILPRRTLRRALMDGVLVQVPVELRMKQWPIAILHPDTSELPQLVLDFVAVLTKELGTEP